ncbi:hypothetical protein, partial [Acidiphilium sp.]|uniref:hypothetical protein n=1 Tax=Acidiphilium sp. TaxID=527 RepID=UPI003CFD69BB
KGRLLFWKKGAKNFCSSGSRWFGGWGNGLGVGDLVPKDGGMRKGIPPYEVRGSGGFTSTNQNQRIFLLVSGRFAIVLRQFHPPTAPSAPGCGIPADHLIPAAARSGQSLFHPRSQEFQKSLIGGRRVRARQSLNYRNKLSKSGASS